MSGRLHPTPEIMEAAYEYLCACQPMSKWKLPPADTVVFVVFHNKNRRGYVQRRGDTWEIGVSDACIGNTDALMRVMAHEMTHVRCDILGDRAEHGTMFHKLAAQVCRYHGFDPKLF